LDWLFNEPVSTTAASFISQHLSQPPTPASPAAPPIAGLFFTPTLRLPQELADEVMQHCLAIYFRPAMSDEPPLPTPPPVPDSVFPKDATDDKLDGLFIPCLSTLTPARNQVLAIALTQVVAIIA